MKYRTDGRCWACGGEQYTEDRVSEGGGRVPLCRRCHEAANRTAAERFKSTALKTWTVKRRTPEERERANARAAEMLMRGELPGLTA